MLYFTSDAVFAFQGMDDCGDRDTEFVVGIHVDFVRFRGYYGETEAVRNYSKRPKATVLTAQVALDWAMRW